MSVQVLEYIDVKKRSLELGYNIPTGLAFLPINFETVHSKDELVYEDSVSTIRKLWRQAGIKETRIETAGESIPYEQRKSFELALPIVFISFSLMSQNSNLVSVALNVLSNYATDFFKGITNEKKVKFDLVVEQNEKGQCKRIHYEGDVAGLNKLQEVLKELKTI